MRRPVAFLFTLAALATALAGYAPEKWNLEARRKFAEQRFGIFIHWGIYANYAQGEWYQQKIGLDTQTYGRMADGFCPSKFDAREWVRCFKDAGAKYVTITTRHHDGFSLWPTKADDGFNIANTPFRRDILGELAEACRAEGLQLNFYYSLMDWHRADYPAGNAARKVFGEQKGDYASYKRFMLAQIAELIDSYHPGNIWFDGEWEHMKRGPDGRRLRHEDDPTSLDWGFDEIYDLIHSKKTLVANNHHATMRAKEDIQLFERDLPGENGTGFSAGQSVTRDRPIEQCDVLQKGVWGYRVYEREFRTAPEVVAMVARAAAKGSNLLMNIGPDGSGRLPARAVDVMRETGVWFRQNGESIYGTSAGPVRIGSDVVSTRRQSTVYLHFLGQKVLSADVPLEGGRVDAATLLATGEAVSVELTTNGCARVSLPADGSAFDRVVRLELRTARQLRLDEAARATEPHTFTSSAGTRFNYRLHEPKDLAVGEKAPLLVFLHGAGERGDDNLRQMVHGVPQILRHAERRGQKLFLLAGQVAYGETSDPQGSKWVQVPWNAVTPSPLPETPSVAMAALIELVAKFRADPRVDASRVYVTGISMGGYGTWDLLLRHPDWFAAAVPCCGGADDAQVGRAKGVPVWIHHGGADTVVPTARGRSAAAALKAAGGNVRYTEYPGVGHNSWDALYGDEKALDWIFAQRRPAPASSAPATAAVPFPEFSAPRAVTQGPHDHLLANYFGINAWSPDNRYLLVLETDLKDRMPDGEPCTLGLVDTEDGNRFIPVTTTRCWNFQEAAMAHWLPWAKDTFVFNDIRDGKFSAVVMNWKTKEERHYPFPVSAVSEDGEWAVSINYARLYLTRPDYGYAGDGQDPRKGVIFPEDDGLWRLNLRTGEAKLILTTAAVKDKVPKVGPNGMSYLCHTVISKDFSRIYFLSRSVEASMEGVKKFKGVNWLTTAFTCKADGSDCRRCFPDGWGSSHFNWKPNLSERDARTMVVTCKWLDRVYTHVEFTVGEENYPRQLGGKEMDFDGHCIYTPDGNFVSGDGYWDKKEFMRKWKIVRLSDMQVRMIGKFFVPEVYRDGYCRCDLHPRWRPDGRQIGFNSVHEGSRQVYVMDVARKDRP